jgi:diguanylate cyclase (GGDEF)-like protein
VKNCWWASQKLRLVLAFAMFAPTAYIILNYSPEQPFGIPLGGLHHAVVRGDLGVHFAAWFVCIVCLAIMARVTNSMSDNLPFVLTTYLLFLNILFFSIERLLDRGRLWPQLHWLTYGVHCIQMLSSIVVAVGVAVALPHLRIMKEVPAIAREQHERFLAAAESSLDDFYIFDGIPDSSGNTVDFRFAYLNPNAERRLNISRESLIGKVLTEVRPFMLSSGLIECYREVVRTGIPFTGEVFIDDEMIRATWINVQVVKLGNGIAITSRDVTERKRLADHVSYLAHHDQLTGLSNRTLLQDRLQQALLRAKRNNQKVAVFMLDIDLFKRINDSLGHADGDALLITIGKRLLSTVRETDTVGRMGGDEFVIVMPDFKSLEDVNRCGSEIVKNIAKPIAIGNREINITVSVGLCIYPDDGLEAEQLLKSADDAMYVVKNRGRNGLGLFTKSMPEEVRDKRKVEDDQRSTLG